MSPRDDNPVTATLIALRDLVARNPERTLAPDERLDRKTAPVTGASRGLGRAVAEQLAAGPACSVRCGRSAGGDAEVFDVDLSDLPTVDHSPRTDTRSLRSRAGR